MKHIVGQPGGMNGPFYSVASQTGNIVAMQITNEINAKHIAALCTFISGDFDEIQAAKSRLRNIFERDGIKIEPGQDNYLIRAAIEAMFS